MADPFTLSLPPPSTNFHELSTTSASPCWNVKPSQTVRRSSQSAEHCLETPISNISPLAEASASGTDTSMLSTPIIAFSNMFPNTPPVEESSLPGEPTISHVSWFNLYMQLHDILNSIRAGTRQVFIDDLKDLHGVMQAVIKTSELGTSVMNTPQFPMTPLSGSGASSDSSMLFCLIVVLKACDLSDLIATIILPPARSNSYPSNALNHYPAEPLFEPSPMSSPVADCVWTTGGAGSSNFSTSSAQLSDENITALVRFDIHLSHLNRFIAYFTQFNQDPGLSADTTARYRRRLSQIHTQIRNVVDATIPAWD